MVLLVIPRSVSDEGSCFCRTILDLPFTQSHARNQSTNLGSESYTSPRSAASGDTRAARSAGIAAATSALTASRLAATAIETGSISLLSGLANLLADAATEAKLVQRRSADDFTLGETIAATPGSVVFQNELMQLIQYAPATDQVHQRPLLYIPPLVNKYYLLDLQPKSSLVRWLVEQGRLSDQLPSPAAAGPAEGQDGGAHHGGGAGEAQP